MRTPKNIIYLNILIVNIVTDLTPMINRQGMKRDYITVKIVQAKKYYCIWLAMCEATVYMKFKEKFHIFINPGAI